MPDWSPPTLMGALAKRRANRIYKDGGWGSQLTFRAPRASGSPLFVQLRLPETVTLDEQPSDAVVSGELVGEGEPLASMTVSFEEGRTPKPEDFPDPGPPWVAQQVTTPTDRAVRVMRANNEPRLELIFAVRSRFGALTFTFNTENEKMMGPKAQDVYRKIVETAWIGTKKRPY